MGMDYEFGDIIDCRNVPGLGHFIIVVGITRKNEVMYYIISSRVYTAFKSILDFFNDCIYKKCQFFFHAFSKEKKKDKLSQYGKLVDAIFLDKENCYEGCLDTDSVVAINNDPELMDKNALDRNIQEKVALFRTTLAPVDMYKVLNIVRYTENISDNKGKQIISSFYKIQKKMNNWKK
jgi:hypothetical protein